MKLLIITNNPDRASFRQRINAYLDILRSGNINCKILKLTSGLLARPKIFKQAMEYDGVFLHKKLLNTFDAYWLRKYSKKIIYNFDDAIMYSDKNPNRNSWSHSTRFRRSVKLADMVIVGSSYLAGHAQKFNSNVEILPLGLKVHDYASVRPPITDGSIRLVWIGSKSTLAYLYEIKPVLEEIGARFDNIVLRIICDDFFDLQNMPTEKCLWSKKTRSLELAGCDIGLAPLPSNRFTEGKCSFKVLEYAAASLPVVASPVGTNADYVVDGITGFHARSMADWIDRLSALIKDADLRNQMAKANRKHVEQFDIDIIGKKLSRVITECIHEDKSG